MTDKPSGALGILSYSIDEAVLTKLSDQRRNQLFGCMHAQNELAFLNRLLMFTQNATADGELHDHAQAIQMWCVLQILAGKLFETWQMLAKRILRPRPVDPMILALCPDHQAALAWLREYFGEPSLKQTPIKLVRDKTAFHYDGLDMGQALSNLGARENTMHLAQHPGNTLYYLGSAVAFRTIFVLIADRAVPPAERSFDERLSDGWRIVSDDINAANLHIHKVLYGFIKFMVEEAVGGPLGEAPEVTTIIAPPPERVGLPPWIDYRGQVSR